MLPEAVDRGPVCVWGGGGGGGGAMEVQGVCAWGVGVGAVMILTIPWFACGD